MPFAARAIISHMPSPTNERQALERERDELSAQLADYRREIAATGGEHQEHRDRLAWQIRRAQKRLGEVEARLATPPPKAASE